MQTKDILDRVNKIFPEMVEIRRHLHRHPELGYEEHETHKFICKQLDKLQIPHKTLAKTGIVGLIEGGAPGKCVALRADMDALPIFEENTVLYRSQNDGVMHACGHDAHMACLLGAAMLLSENRQNFHGSVKLIFQPGEEGIGGAKPMIDEGALEAPYVDAVAGAHVMSHIPAGKALFKHGPIMASPDDFEITITGKSGHGAYPHKASDPVVCACQLVCALQTVASRLSNPLDPTVVTVGKIEGGTATNIIPDQVKLWGTARTISRENRDEIAGKMEQIIKGITQAMGCGYDFRFIYLYPPTINDGAVTDAFAAAAQKIIGKENVLWGTEPSMSGEDFAFFAQERPATFFHLGCGNEKLGLVNPIHNSKFDIDETCLKVGAACFTQFALDFLNQE